MLIKGPDDESDQKPRKVPNFLRLSQNKALFKIKNFPQKILSTNSLKHGKKFLNTRKLWDR